MKHAARIAAVLAAAALVLTACGSGNGDPSSSSTIPSSADFNDADVLFATDMIPHHAQALVMVDMTRGRSLDPEFSKLTEQILAAQGPEIQTMTGWLQDWDQPVPETMRDHVNADEGSSDMGGMNMGGSDMPGMMSDQDLADLDAASGSTFETMWLQMMITHHEGAIEMAKTEVSDGEYPASIDLATSIETSQAKEITQMKALLEN